MDNQTRPRISISELRNRARSKARSQRVLEQVFAHGFNDDHRTPHVLPEVIETKAQSQSEVKVERKLHRSVTLPLVGLKYSITPIKFFNHHLNCVYGLNFRNSNLQTTCFGSLQSLAAKHTSDHRAPHVPPDEIALEAQKHSEVNVEPKLWLSVQDQINVVEFYNSHLLRSLAAKGTSDHKTSPVPPDEIALEAQNQSAKRHMNEKTTEWVLLITSVLLEAISADFDQVGYVLMGMVISFLAWFLSGLDLICKARKEGVKRSQPSGGLLDYYGLAAPVWQCFYSTMEYLYTRKNQQNPLKICYLLYLLCSNLHSTMDDGEASKLGSKQIFIDNLLCAAALKPIIWCESPHDSLDFSLDLYFPSETAGYEITDCATNWKACQLSSVLLFNMHLICGLQRKTPNKYCVNQGFERVDFSGWVFMFIVAVSLGVREKEDDDFEKGLKGERWVQL
ncbi:hypothetical protein SADUNF_Sadunf06G0215900 [Salix dunnii]|uniref:Uncharacterized protein n=1 Tax=Salix dunnii TaxID=1413687 RepID=A0A835K8L7_9ROSI|nr:hypothetical protein SADUNF_Sadunf06G0215900 [Salix dunnii]